MTPEIIENERAKFEAWAKSMNEGDRLKLSEDPDFEGEYEDSQIQAMWEGWIARASFLLG